MDSILSCDPVSGTEYENAVALFLNEIGINARRTYIADYGVDIIAEKVIHGKTYTFNLQCKYHNKTLGYSPIQEVI